ncbi:MAG: hypothetical protein L0228_09190 [Planctomycetes bacterium]|nr:hypothetical protein [Planctomycetota bacterium]
MRLTLRTLLAYLDDILDPADKEELAQKIQSSEFAEELVHRTRDTMRRLRLSAPQVVGTGMALDPNTVAEYLDNVLPPEQVGDYERICLESDVHLAEAAACHHVLTMVLGEPADVEPRARQRMYMVPAESRERRRLRAEPARARTGATTTAAAPVMAASATTAGARQSAATYEIPEYLRTRSWWQSRGAMAALAAALIVGTAFYFLSGMLGWFGGSSDVAAVTPDASEAPAGPQIEIGPAEPATNPAESVVADAAPAATSNPPAPEPNTTSQPLATPPQPLSPDIGPSQPEASATTAEASTTVESSTAPPAAVEPAAAPVVATAPTNPPATDSSVLPVGTEPATGVDPTTAIPPQGDVNSNVASPATAVTPTTEATTEPAATVNDAPPLAAATPGGPVIAVADADPSPTDTADVDDGPKGPPELGTYLSGKTVLLRYDEPTGGWFRVEPRSAVIAGQRLLALPEFRPKITLASGVHLDLSGGTQVLMAAGDEVQAEGLPAASAETPAIEVLYGRLILINTSNVENQVRLKLGSTVGDAKLARNATLAVEVERQYVPGNDPRTAAAPVAVHLFVTSGGVTWQDASNEFVVDKPSRWTIVQNAPVEVVADSAPPEWIDEEPAVHLSEQKYGAPVIDRTLVSDRPVDIQLLELFKGRDRREVKSLVTRSSIHVGLFAPFIDALRDSGQKWPTWRTHIETLRSAMAHSPDSAERVYQALVDQRGRPAAGDLYEMLCGYNAEQIGTTPEQVKSGALARLIDWLEEDSLDYRVLAVHDLWEITGKQLMPNPAANLTVRKQNVRRWRDRLESGELEVIERP